MNKDSNPGCSPEAVTYDLIYCAEGVCAPIQLQQGNEVAFLTESREEEVLDRQKNCYI